MTGWEVFAGVKELPVRKAIVWSSYLEDLIFEQTTLSLRN